MHAVTTRNLATLGLVALIVAVLIAACTPAAPAEAPAEEPIEVKDASPEEPATEPANAEPEQTEETAEPEQTEPAEAAATAPTANLTDGCVTDYTEGIDYFPDKVEVESAASFSIEYHDNYKVVTTLTPWPGAEESFQYVLVQCGTPTPEGYDDATVMEVPVDTAVAMSTSYITHMEDLGLLDHLVGLDSFLYVSNPTVREMIDAGDLTEIAPTGEINIEAALDLAPGMIMTFSSGMPEYDTHPILIEAGLPVVMNGDWTETEPLARAEWVKFMALFFNAEARAAELYDNVVNEYTAAAELAANAGDNPTVVSDAPYEGTWYVPAGEAYTARLISDAGGDYIFADNEETGTLYLDFETVYDQGLDADVWINVWGYGSRSDLLAADARFGDFKAFQEGNIYGNDARGTEFGTEIWETGVARPQLVLLDLIKIFHPELLPDHELYYYRQLPE
jgi:iron complex transport system substrate-binding protein